MNQHLIQATESLADLANTYQLSGWQGLYFAPVNHAFRQQFPDPWQIPSGVEIRIPTSSAEQFAALQDRRAELQAREEAVKRLADEQRQRLVAPFGTTDNADSQTFIAELAEDIVRSSAQAIGLLKAPDWVSAHRDLALLNDALQRWRTPGLETTASLLSLLTRAVRGVPWSVPSASAQAWCDPSSAQFWAKAFLSPNLALLHADPEAQRRSVRVMLGAQQTVVDQLLRHLRAMRTEAIMETNHLARVIDDAE